MKPEWSAAPDWAEYLTQDRDGQYNWWSHEPIALCFEWNYRQWDTGMLMRYAGEAKVAKGGKLEWKSTLEQRP